MKIYSNIYIGIFKLFFKRTETGEYSASFLLSLLVAANLIALVNLMEYFRVIKFLIQRNTGIILGTILVVFNCFYFNFTGNHKRILAKSNKKKNGDKEYTYSIFFMIFSVVFFLWTSSLVRK
jgi:hypothetical protein